MVKAILEAAKSGDMTVAKLILDRLLPPIKAVAQTVRLDLPADGTPLDHGRAVLAATAAGTLAPDIAGQLVSALGDFCRVEEVENLRDRIGALESATPPPRATSKSKP